MTRYQVIAKKFRPQTFSEVFGQQPIIATLKNALKMGRVAHAYLFTGCRGSGKTTLVRLFAKAINCHNLSDQFEPCNNCPSCQDITQGNSLDILEIDGASNRGIDDIRQINDSVGYAPAHGGYKIIIIDEVHMLTKEAFNALLKTLEEPPEKVKFFFATTEPHKVLSTITSRCQRFDLLRIPTGEIVKKLTLVTQALSVNITEDALTLIAKMGEGSLRDSESLLDQAICYQEGEISYDSISTMLGLLPLDTFAQIDQAYHASDTTKMFQIAHTIFNTGIDIPHAFDMLIDHYRNIMLLAYSMPLDPASFSKEALTIYNTGAKIYSRSALLAIIDYISSIITQRTQMLHRKVDIEMTLLFILKQKNRVSFEALIEQLNALQAKINTPSLTPESKPVKAPQPMQLVEPKKMEPFAEIQPINPKPIIEKEIVQPKPAAPVVTAEQTTLLDQSPPKPAAPPAVPSKAVAPMPTPTPLEPPVALDTQVKLDSLLQFAAIELDGSLK